MAEERKFTFMEKCIISYIGERIPEDKVGKEYVSKGDALGFATRKMTEAKDTGIKGSVAATKGWADMFNLALRTLVKDGYVEEKKSFLSSKLTLTPKGYEVYKRLKEAGEVVK